MSAQRLFSMIFGMVVLPTVTVIANAQTTEQAARELASSTVRSELHTAVHFKSDQFLGVQRDEELEETLAVAVGGRAGLRFIYKVSPTGYEIRENAVLYHVWTDVDPTCIVAVSPTDGTVYRMPSFALKKTIAEFQKLMKEANVKISSADQAEAVVEFYRKVNPENYENFTPISSLIDLK
jgi:hypothetical protein